jgi:hypothetical protein
MTVIDLAEARKANRRRVLDMALIRFGEMSVGCVIRNLNDTGAALDVGSQSDIPRPIHIDRYGEEKNLFLQHRVAQEPSHRCVVPLIGWPWSSHRKSASYTDRQDRRSRRGSRGTRPAAAPAHPGTRRASRGARRPAEAEGQMKAWNGSAGKTCLKDLS